MYTSPFLLAVVASLAAADIGCDAPIATGPLYWSPASSLSYSGQIGVLKTRGNTEHLAIYPNANVLAHEISVIPCNSTFLNASNPSSPSTTTDLYVKLQLADDATKCLGLEALDGGSGLLSKQTCDTTETDAQSRQFWLRDAGFGGLAPMGAPIEEAIKLHILQFNSGVLQEVIANSGSCSGGDGCEDGERIALLVKDSAKHLELRDPPRACWGTSRGCAGTAPTNTTHGSE